MATARFSKNQQIFLCTDINPKQANSASYPIFQLYFKCRTVGEFLAAGGRRADIIWDAKRGYILLDWDTEQPSAVVAAAPAVKPAAVKAKPAKKHGSGIAAMVAQLAPVAAAKKAKASKAARA